jgi:hypothetical protein
MTYDNTPLPIAAVELSMAKHGGHLIAAMGEDGDQFLILGHLSDTEARAVVLAYISTEYGYDGDLPEKLNITRDWYTFTPHRDDCTDEVCAPCVEGRCDDCTKPDDCVCADGGDGHGGSWCYCDEWGWFACRWPRDAALPFPAAGHPAYHAATWVWLG